MHVLKWARYESSLDTRFVHINKHKTTVKTKQRKCKETSHQMNRAINHVQALPCFMCFCGQCWHLQLVLPLAAVDKLESSALTSQFISNAHFCSNVLWTANGRSSAQTAGVRSSRSKARFWERKYISVARMHTFSNLYKWRLGREPFKTYKTEKSNHDEILKDDCQRNQNSINY